MAMAIKATLDFSSAGGEQHIHFAGGRVLGDLLGERNQLVGGVPAGRNNDQDLVAARVGLDRAASGGQGSLSAGDRPGFVPCAELLNQ